MAERRWPIRIILVRRREPIPEWVALGRAQDALIAAVRRDLERALVPALRWLSRALSRSEPADG